MTNKTLTKSKLKKKILLSPDSLDLMYWDELLEQSQAFGGPVIPSCASVPDIVKALKDWATDVSDTALWDKVNKMRDGGEDVPDMVNHPPHYNQYSIKPIDVMESWNLGGHLWNVVKYISRHEFKGAKIKDMKKARWYLDRYIAKLEREENNV